MAEPGESLTERERELIGLVATGATNRMIAQELSISPNTVKVHLRNIFTKLEISSRTEATLVAIREGWVQVDGEEAPVAADTAELPPVSAEPETGPALAPLSTAGRIFLVASFLSIMLAFFASWPRAASAPAESCPNEFTAECTAGDGALTIEEPESLWVSGPAMPAPRGRMAMTALGGDLFVIGGETLDGVVGTVSIFHSQDDLWTQARDKPVPAANLAAVVFEGRIYAIGGNDAQRGPLATVEIYDPGSDTWSEGAPLPVPLSATAAAQWGDKIFVFGGFNGSNYTAEVYLYDPLDGTWDELPAMPTARGFAGAAVVRDQVFVIGGYDSKREYAICERFDPRTAQWDQCPSMSTPRGGVGVATVAGQVYVIGGGWDSFVTFSERLNPNTGVWKHVETPLLLAGGEWRHMGVATVGTRVYAMGGWQSGRYLDINQAYETLPNRLFLPAASSQ